VTAGHDCQSGAAIGIQQQLRRTRAFKDCAWPARLEHLLNSVIFDGDEIFEVSNEAMGGMSSDWGAFSLKNIDCFRIKSVHPMLLCRLGE
jgi:hypothetical protein